MKMLSQHSRQGKREFENEAKLLASVQHRNVVNLLGYCAYGENKLLVYEYIANESLDKLLFSKYSSGFMLFVFPLFVVCLSFHSVLDDISCLNAEFLYQ